MSAVSRRQAAWLIGTLAERCPSALAMNRMAKVVWQVWETTLDRRPRHAWRRMSAAARTSITGGGS